MNEIVSKFLGKRSLSTKLNISVGVSTVILILLLIALYFVDSSIRENATDIHIISNEYQGYAYDASIDIVALQKSLTSLYTGEGTYTDVEKAFNVLKDRFSKAPSGLYKDYDTFFAKFEKSVNTFGDTLKTASKSSKVEDDLYIQLLELDESVRLLGEALNEETSSSITDLDKRLSNVFTVAYILITVGVLGLNTISVLVFRSTRKVLRDVEEALEHLSVGIIPNHIETHDQKELGAMVNGVNKIRSTFSEFSSKLNVNADKIVELNVDLANHANETMESFEDIVKAISHNNTVFETTTDKVSTTVTAVHETSSTLATLTETIEDVTSTFESIKERTETGMQEINHCVSALEMSAQGAEETEVIVKELESKLVEVNKMVTLINNISSQTNLLSLNASIEAARAGEAGRGFAVVAKEVKKLSEQSKESTDLIEGIIRDINESTYIVTETINAMLMAIKDSSKDMDKVLNSFSDVNSKVHQAVPKVERSLEESAVLTEVLNTVIDYITQVQEDITSATSTNEEVSASSQEQLKALEGVKQIVESLHASSMDTKETVGFIQSSTN